MSGPQRYPLNHQPSFGSAPGTPLSPSNNQGSAPSFRTNVNRTKTKRWVEAKTVSYDGDDWGDTDEEDVNEEEQPPEQPPIPAHYAQTASNPHAGLTPGPAYERGPPPPLHTQFAPDRGHNGGARSVSAFSPGPAVGASLQKDRAVSADASNNGSLQQTTPSSSENTSHTISLPQPFIRPADIYKRIQEERAKERRSQESNRSDIPSAPAVPHQSTVAASKPISIPLDSTPSPSQPISNTALPELKRLSGFGADFMSASEEPVAASQEPASSQPEKPLHHNNSLGFRSAVNQAFDVPQTPISSTGSVVRTNSESTSNISPIIPGGNDFDKAPTITEEPSESNTANEPGSVDLVPGYRRDLSIPNPENGPARQPLVASEEGLPQPENVAPSDSLGDSKSLDSTPEQISHELVASSGAPLPRDARGPSTLQEQGAPEVQEYLDISSVVTSAEQTRVSETSHELPTPLQIPNPERSTPTPPIVEPHPSMSVETSPHDYESDRLRKEIIRSLSPDVREKSPFTAPPPDAEATSSVRAGHESTYLPREYDSYWEEHPDIEATDPLQPKPSASVELDVTPQPISEAATKVVSQALPASEDYPKPQLKKKFSWEEPEFELEAVSKEASQPMTHLSPVSDSEPMARGADSQEGDIPTFVVDAPVELPSFDHSLVAGNEMFSNEESFKTDREPSSELSISKEDTGGEPPTAQQPESVSPVEVAPFASSAPTPQVALTKSSAQPASADLKLVTFRQVLNMTSPQERIRSFKQSREQFATMEEGMLSNWISKTSEMLPEHSDLISRNGQLPPGFQPHVTSRGKLSKLLPTSTSSSDVTQATFTPPGHVRKPSGSPLGGISRQNVESKSKDLLHSAGVLGGKAAGGAKGLFSRGKNKFRSGGTDKGSIASSPKRRRRRSLQMLWSSADTKEEVVSPEPVPESSSPLQSGEPDLSKPVSKEYSHVPPRLPSLKFQENPLGFITTGGNPHSIAALDLTAITQPPTSVKGQGYSEPSRLDPSNRDPTIPVSKGWKTIHPINTSISQTSTGNTPMIRQMMGDDTMSHSTAGVRDDDSYHYCYKGMHGGRVLPPPGNLLPTVDLYSAESNASVQDLAVRHEVEKEEVITAEHSSSREENNFERGFEPKDAISTTYVGKSNALLDKASSISTRSQNISSTGETHPRERIHWINDKSDTLTSPMSACIGAWYIKPATTFSGNEHQTDPKQYEIEEIGLPPKTANTFLASTEDVVLAESGSSGLSLIKAVPKIASVPVTATMKTSSECCYSREQQCTPTSDLENNMHNAPPIESMCNGGLSEIKYEAPRELKGGHTFPSEETRLFEANPKHTSEEKAKSQEHEWTVEAKVSPPFLQVVPPLHNVQPTGSSMVGLGLTEGSFIAPARVADSEHPHYPREEIETATGSEASPLVTSSESNAVNKPNTATVETYSRHTPTKGKPKRPGEQEGLPAAWRVKGENTSTKHSHSDVSVADTFSVIGTPEKRVFSGNGLVQNDGTSKEPPAILEQMSNIPSSKPKDAGKRSLDIIGDHQQQKLNSPIKPMEFADIEFKDSPTLFDHTALTDSEPASDVESHTRKVNDKNRQNEPVRNVAPDDQLNHASKYVLIKDGMAESIQAAGGPHPMLPFTGTVTSLPESDHITNLVIEPNTSIKDHKKTKEDSWEPSKYIGPTQTNLAGKPEDFAFVHYQDQSMPTANPSQLSHSADNDSRRSSISDLEKDIEKTQLLQTEYSRFQKGSPTGNYNINQNRGHHTRADSLPPFTEFADGEGITQGSHGDEPPPPFSEPDVDYLPDRKPGEIKTSSQSRSPPATPEPAPVKESTRINFPSPPRSIPTSQPFQGNQEMHRTARPTRRPGDASWDSQGLNRHSPASSVSSIGRVSTSVAVDSRNRTWQNGGAAPHLIVSPNRSRHPEETFSNAHAAPTPPSAHHYNYASRYDHAIDRTPFAPGSRDTATQRAQTFNTLSSSISRGSRRPGQSSINRGNLFGNRNSLEQQERVGTSLGGRVSPYDSKASSSSLLNHPPTERTATPQNSEVKKTRKKEKPRSNSSAETVTGGQKKKGFRISNLFARSKAEPEAKVHSTPQQQIEQYTQDDIRFPPHDDRDFAGTPPPPNGYYGPPVSLNRRNPNNNSIQQASSGGGIFKERLYGKPHSTAPPAASPELRHVHPVPSTSQQQQYRAGSNEYAAFTPSHLSSVSSGGSPTSSHNSYPHLFPTTRAARERWSGSRPTAVPDDIRPDFRGRSRAMDLHMRSRSPRSKPIRADETKQPSANQYDPAYGLGRFNAVPVTIRTGDQERPWSLRLPEDSGERWLANAVREGLSGPRDDHKQPDRKFDDDAEDESIIPTRPLFSFPKPQRSVSPVGHARAEGNNRLEDVEPTLVNPRQLQEQVRLYQQIHGRSHGQDLSNIRRPSDQSITGKRPVNMTARSIPPEPRQPPTLIQQQNEDPETEHVSYHGGAVPTRDKYLDRDVIQKTVQPVELPVKNEDDEEVAMSSTAYPGQEWQPEGYSQWLPY